MEPQTEALNMVIDTLEANITLFDAIKIDRLPTNQGISCEISTGYNKDIYLNKQSSKVIPLLFLCKHKDQQVAYDTLCKVGNCLQNLSDYPDGPLFSWEKAEVSSEPSKIGNDGRYYIYSCIVDITIYF